MKFFRLYATVAGALVGFIIYVASLCTLGNSCMRLDQNQKKVFAWKSLTNGLFQPTLFSYRLLKNGEFIDALAAFLKPWNPLFIIPFCILVANLIVNKDLDGFDTSSVFDWTSLATIVLASVGLFGSDNKIIFIVLAMIAFGLALYSRYTKKLHGKPGKLKDKASKQAMAVAGVAILIFAFTSFSHHRKYSAFTKGEKARKQRTEERFKDMEDSALKSSLMSQKGGKFTKSNLMSAGYFISFSLLVYSTGYALFAKLD